jgi:hypothetical protein
MRKRGRPRQSLPQQQSLKPQGASEGPPRTPTSHFDAHAGKDSYAVEVVLAGIFRLGVPHCQIRWEGLPSGSDTLEPISHLQDPASQAVIHAYLKSRSCDDEDGASTDAAEESASAAVPLSLSSLSKSSASFGEGVSLSGAPITVDADEDGRIEVKHARVSSVWSHFGPKYLTSKGVKVSRYNYCRTILSACNTTNLRNHLLRLHGSQLVKTAVADHRVCHFLNFANLVHGFCVQFTFSLFDDPCHYMLYPRPRIRVVRSSPHIEKIARCFSI